MLKTKAQTMSRSHLPRASAALLITASLMFGACVPDELTEVTDFGANPGQLNMYERPPITATTHPHTVIIALHGCTQRAGAFQDLGLFELADELGAGLILPEQRLRNNPSACFNWMNPDDVRGGGESGSILSMLKHYRERYLVAPGQVYVLGLSAGGVMATSLLAIAPEQFSAGASFAGGPYGCAGALSAAQCMSGTLKRSPAEWAAKVTAQTRSSTWPRYLAIHGASDKTSDVSNAVAAAAQLAALHGLPAAPNLKQSEGRITTSTWRHEPEAPSVELIIIEGMGHAVPFDAARCDTADLFSEDVGLCGLRRALQFFTQSAQRPPR